MGTTSPPKGNDLMKLSMEKALWISQSDQWCQDSRGEHAFYILSLVARMRDRVVEMSVPLYEEFKARVQHVDVYASRMYVSPLCASGYRNELLKAFSLLDATKEARERPASITSKSVYLVTQVEGEGKSFRGVVTEEKAADCYTVLDVDSGMVKTVTSDNIVQLPLALCDVPPLVICMAVPPTDVGTRSLGRISEGSLIICKFKPIPLLCVEDAYPPVLLCDVRADDSTETAQTRDALVAEVRRFMPRAYCMLLPQQSVMAPALNASLPAFVNAQCAEGNALMVQPTSLGPCFASFATAIGSDLAQDLAGEQAESAISKQVRSKPKFRESSRTYGKEVMRRQSAVQSPAVPVTNTSSFHRMPLRSSLIPSDSSSEYGYLSSPITNRRRTNVSRYGFHTEYGEPPKHFLIEYESSNPSTKSNTDGVTANHSTHKRSLNRASCTICQGEGHFANNCPSNVKQATEQAVQAVGDRVSDQTGGTFTKEVLYYVRPRDKDGNVLYTSDESSEETNGVEHPGSEKECRADGCEIKTRTDSLFAGTQVSIPVNSDSASTTVSNTGDHVKALKFVHYMKHVEVEHGREYIVKRSDDDHDNTNWPLFFVQIQNEEKLQVIEQYLDFVQLQKDLPDERVVPGTLCVCYCNAFGAMFRAVITDIVEDRVEVLYVDYGNYEVVDRKQLKSIDGQVGRSAIDLKYMVSNVDEKDHGGCSNGPAVTVLTAVSRRTCLCAPADTCSTSQHGWQLKVERGSCPQWEAASPSRGRSVQRQSSFRSVAEFISLSCPKHVFPKQPHDT
uniref:Tudor domain-containing protein n=1 Tax=Ascaris lumbricoides TaxID=6252 RepID=A0A9J2NZF1_ASCLU